MIVKTLMVDTAPRRKTTYINLGMEIAATYLNADRCHWQDIVDPTQYDKIGFNVAYPLFIPNITAFLTKHGIEPIQSKRQKPILIAGGPGVMNVNNALKFIVDTTFKGEIDGDIHDKRGWKRRSILDTQAIIMDRQAVIELTRGCKYRCHFCEFSHIIGGSYREKPATLAIQQLQQCVDHGIKRITLRTANLAGYTDLDTIMEFCIQNRIKQPWGNIALLDVDRILPWMKQVSMSAPMMGVESLNEATRYAIGKPISNRLLHHAFDAVMAISSRIHVYLIYGLPDDDYDEWIRWMQILADKRKQYTHNIRIDFSIRNLYPCPGTPLSGHHLVDFTQKHSFLKRWIEAMRDTGLASRNWNMWYGNDGGRHGRKKSSYCMIMSLMLYGPEVLTSKLIYALPGGISSSVSDRQALRFINYR